MGHKEQGPPGGQFAATVWSPSPAQVGEPPFLFRLNGLLLP